jgi:AhpD family alkylhydroperoxidase
VSEIARTEAAHVRAVMEGGTAPRRTKELCALMVSWLNACEHCVSAHSDYARELGVPEAQLEELFDYARSDAFDDAERAALSAAVALTREPRALPPAVRAALEAHYDEQQRVEIIAAIGLYNYLNRRSNALA